VTVRGFESHSHHRIRGPAV